MANVMVTRRGEERVGSGHPWVYRSDIAEAHASAGEIVTVTGPRGRVLGDALFSDRSEISIRMLTRGDVRADDDWLGRRHLLGSAFWLLRRAMRLQVSQRPPPRRCTSE